MIGKRVEQWRRRRSATNWDSRSTTPTRCRQEMCEKLRTSITQHHADWAQTISGELAKASELGQPQHHTDPAQAVSGKLAKAASWDSIGATPTRCRRSATGWRRPANWDSRSACDASAPPLGRHSPDVPGRRNWDKVSHRVPVKKPTVPPQVGQLKPSNSNAYSRI